MNIRFFLISSLVFLSLPSCNRFQVRHRLKQMMSDEIVMPAELEMVQRDTVTVCGMDSRAKCILYIDSTECTSCRIGKLNRYSDLYHSAKNNAVFDFIVLISPRADERSSVIHRLQLSVDFPVYLDKEHRFLELNRHIPRDDRFHTFLTNQDGKVIFVGDPTSGEKMKTLFHDAWKTLH